MKIEIGSAAVLTSGRKATITEVISDKSVEVQVVGTDHRFNCHPKVFLRNGAKDYFHPIVYGVGYFGSGIHKAFTDKKRSTREYTLWRHMLERCYSPECLNAHPSYKGCLVSEDWHNFQNFAAWCKAQPQYAIDNPRWCLDKDILGNKKLYSPDNCCFVPRQINNLFLLRDAERNEYGLGVSKRGDKFLARVSFGNKRMYSPRYEKLEDAKSWYETTKKETICLLANEYKDSLAPLVYKALINYQITF